MKVKKMTGCF